jgi:excisionase family DNA binding protein
MAMAPPEERVPLYVRLPRAQADALDRLVDATGRRKQQLVSEMIGDRLELGHAQVFEDAPAPRFAPAPPSDAVLTLDELADLLRVDAAAVRERAERGELPGRRMGLADWRFSQTAVLAWLAEGEAGGAPDG